MALANPVIVVPGITATYLQDEYCLPPEAVWTVLRKKYDRLSLHPDNLKYEAVEPARVRAGEIFEVSYAELIEELRHDLADKGDLPVPVYPFAYDWRLPLDDAEAKLGEFIEEVAERTRLIKHYHKAGYDGKVNLVAHSMGGLVVAGYLEGIGSSSSVEKVVTLAAPFQGSFEAVIKIATGTANLGFSAPSSREREAARLTPSLYHLLPSFTTGLITEAGLPNSLFSPDIWQSSVVDSIAEFIRLKGLPTTTRKADAAQLFQQLLKGAEQHRRRIDNFKLSDAGLQASDWLAVVGADATTRVELGVKKQGDSTTFDFASSHRRNEWDSDDPVERRKTGDGTVPFEGAMPQFLDEGNLVCVTPDDYGYWEVKDKGLSRIAGFHGTLPNMNLLHRLIVRFFKGRPDSRGNTWGRRVPGVANWKPPLPLTEKS